MNGWFIEKPRNEGDTYPFHTPIFGLANHDLVPWVVVLVVRSIMPFDGIYRPGISMPSVQLIWWSSRPPLPTTWYLKSSSCPLWTLWWMSTGRSHNLPLDPPQGSLVWAGTGWLTRPLCYSWCESCFLTPFGTLAQLGWGWYICPVPGRCSTHKGMPVSGMTMRRSQFQWEDVWLSALVHHFIGGGFCCNLMHHLTGLILPPILNLPLSLKGISLH